MLDSAGSTLVEWGRQQQQHGAIVVYGDNYDSAIVVSGDNYDSAIVVCGDDDDAAARGILDVGCRIVSDRKVLYVLSILRDAW